MVAEIGIIMNSAAIIALAIVAKKHTKRIKEINEIQLRKEQRMEQETKWGKELLAGRIEAAEIDLKSLRMEITGRGKRQPVPESYFGDRSIRIDFSDGNSIKESELEYIAEIALKAIASELPEEKRTPEIIKEIIKRTKWKLQQSKIASK